MSGMKDLFGDEAFSLPKPEPGGAFDGETYDISRDYLRLDCQLGKVFNLMKDGEWRTLGQIADHVGGSEASVSARLRDLRKKKYGSHVIQREHIANGLYKYRLDEMVPEE
jgi:hypothetical protein